MKINITILLFLFGLTSQALAGGAKFTTYYNDGWENAVETSPLHTFVQVNGYEVASDKSCQLFANVEVNTVDGVRIESSIALVASPTQCKVIKKSLEEGNDEFEMSVNFFHDDTLNNSPAVRKTFNFIVNSDDRA